MHYFVIVSALFIISCTNTAERKSTPEVKRDTSTELSSVLPQQPANATSKDSAVAFIRKAYLEINNMPLQSHEFKFSVDNCVDEGTAVYMLDDAGDIRKVVETGFIGDGSWTTIYYYQKGHFIFSLQTLMGGPAIGPVTTTRYRKYVYDDKVVRMLENDRYLFAEDSLLTPAAKEYKIVDAYKSKDFGSAFCQ